MGQVRGGGVAGSMIRLLWNRGSCLVSSWTVWAHEPVGCKVPVYVM